MVTPLTKRTQEIRSLNDAFRKSFTGGRVVITGGTSALSDEERLALYDAIKKFDDFNPMNDPYGEHDFGSIEFQGDKFYWKIDCYDRNQINHSPDSTNVHLTKRVLTIMKAEEY